MNLNPCPSCQEGSRAPIEKRLFFTYKGKTYRIEGVKVFRCDLELARSRAAIGFKKKILGLPNQARGLGARG